MQSDIIKKIGKKYNVEFDLSGKTYDAVGCKKCNNTGYYDRIGIFEVLLIDDEMRALIAENGSVMDIRNVALKNGYVPLIVDGINRVIDGTTNLQEINNKLALY